ncbi:hypothetical protein F511_10723 [Dorcoceras hygrometricum]|uniref:Uncharacterized protein n=1 Tax=Dorcoceras hygrometricum TaxID=472368 RepID=A0A2Z7AGG6_9LAMI|nr:hypothetical protein F511_10723 [Dorcoceras hygrometricum]
MRLTLSQSAHRLLHINSPVQIFPIWHIFPTVDNSSEKVLAWLYFVSFAFIASAGYLAFSTPPKLRWLRTQSLLLYAALDLRLSCLHFNILRFNFGLNSLRLISVPLLLQAGEPAWLPCTSGSKLLYQLGRPLTVSARYLRPVQLRHPLTVPVLDIITSTPVLSICACHENPSWCQFALAAYLAADRTTCFLPFSSVLTLPGTVVTVFICAAGPLPVLVILGPLPSVSLVGPVHICYTLTGTLYPPPGAPPAGSKPRPAEKPGKPENTYRQQYTSPKGTSWSNPSTEINTNSIRKATDKYANAMQGIKATTESREPKDRNNSSTARSDQREDRQWPRGILSTWEIPTHLQYTVPDAKQTAPPAVAHSGDVRATHSAHSG